MAVKIKGQYESNLRCSLTHQSGKKINTDAPLDNNGKGEAFSPTDLVAAALASCMLTIIAIRAAAKDIAIGNPTFQIVKNMQSVPRRIEEIEVRIEFDAEICLKDRNYLENEARNCPVALSISPEIKQIISFKYA